MNSTTKVFDSSFRLEKSNILSKFKNIYFYTHKTNNYYLLSFGALDLWYKEEEGEKEEAYSGQDLIRKIVCREILWDSFPLAQL